MALPPAKNPDIALLFRLRRYFIPFLFPAAALLVLALFQANLTLAATSAGQRLLDHFLHTAPSQSGEQIDGAFRSDELRGALEMVGWLVAAAIVAVGAGQARSVIHEKFTLRLQREIIESLVHEDGETRASRQSGSTLRTYVSDAPSLSAFLIFGIIGIGEHLVRLGTYLVGLIAIPGGWKIVLVVGGLGFLFQTVVVKAFANAERKTGVSADQLKENLFNKASRYFELLERLIFFGGEKAIAREISEQAQQGAKIRRKSLLLASSREAISGILMTISLPLTVLLLLGSPGFSPGSVVQAQMLTNLFLLSIVALCAMHWSKFRGCRCHRLQWIVSLARAEESPSEYTVSNLRSRETKKYCSIVSISIFRRERLLAGSVVRVAANPLWQSCSSEICDRSPAQSGLTSKK